MLDGGNRQVVEERAGKPSMVGGNSMLHESYGWELVFHVVNISSSHIIEMGVLKLYSRTNEAITSLASKYLNRRGLVPFPNERY